MESKKKKSKSRKISQTIETYNDMVGVEAIKRVGKSPQLKGNIQEILLMDRKNFSKDGLLKGRVTKMSKSVTSQGSDLITVKNGKVVERIQVKDITSKGGMHKLKEQLVKKKYHNSKLYGSPETVELGTKANITREIKNTEISSKTTTRIADNAGVKVKNKNLLTNNFADIASQAKSSALLGATIGVVGSAITNIKEFKDGNISAGELAEELFADGIKEGASSGAKTIVAVGLKEGGKTIAKKIGNESLRKVFGSNAATAVAFGAAEQLFSVVQYVKGDIDGTELAEKTCENVGSTGGALGGAAIGAAIGSAVPVVGTAIGAVIGSVLGSFGGGKIGKFFCDCF